MDKEEVKPATRIRFEGDEEDGRVGRDPHRSRHLSRSSSIGSLSIHSTSRAVQPETALPITYRTLSIEVDENLHKHQQNVRKAKDKATTGMY
jgi:sodium/potassium-transporting ATPase subunit alpha